MPRATRSAAPAAAAPAKQTKPPTPMSDSEGMQIEPAGMDATQGERNENETPKFSCDGEAGVEKCRPVEEKDTCMGEASCTDEKDACMEETVSEKEKTVSEEKEAKDDCEQPTDELSSLPEKTTPKDNIELQYSDNDKSAESVEFVLSADRSSPSPVATRGRKANAAAPPKKTAAAAKSNFEVVVHESKASKGVDFSDDTKVDDGGKRYGSEDEMDVDQEEPKKSAAKAKAAPKGRGKKAAAAGEEKPKAAAKPRPTRKAAAPKSKKNEEEENDEDEGTPDVPEKKKKAPAKGKGKKRAGEDQDQDGEDSPPDPKKAKGARATRSSAPKKPTSPKPNTFTLTAEESAKLADDVVNIITEAQWKKISNNLSKVEGTDRSYDTCKKILRTRIAGKASPASKKGAKAATVEKEEVGEDMDSED